MDTDDIEGVVRAVEESIVIASTDIIMVGVNPRPQVHLFFDDQDQPYVGYVVCRFYRRGTDAAAAIAGMGRVPGILLANRVIVAWEEADLRASLDGPGDHPTALVTTHATLTDHVLTWRPFDAEFGSVGRAGVPTCHPRWGAVSQHTDVGLPQPIDALLAEWRSFRSGDINATLLEMERQGYELHFVKA